jgi:acetyltransferase-like isoleucine patch superfamily enzyme
VSLRDRIVERRFRARVRREIQPERFAAFGADAIVHPPADIARPEAVSIGAQTFILANATFALGPGARVSIGARTYLGRDLTVVCLGAVEIGDDVMGSDRLLFADTAPDPRLAGEPVMGQGLAAPRTVRVEDGVFLGTGAMVLAGVTVGARSLVGAGAVVTRDVPANCVVVGNPARIVRHYDRERAVWVEGPPSSYGVPAPPGL